MANKKENILENYAYIVIDDRNKKGHLIAKEEDLERMVETMEIKDGDLIIKLTSDTLKVAELVNHIKII